MSSHGFECNCNQISIVRTDETLEVNSKVIHLRQATAEFNLKKELLVSDLCRAVRNGKYIAS